MREMRNCIYFGQETSKEEITCVTRFRLLSKRDLRQIDFEAADWVQLAQDSIQWLAFVTMVMNT